ncbi:hypothetical protein [Clostridium uliginosum]|uniref:DUF5666 domain-containing protein n=1 Tax=Clostridium uliginosum TaxID=119641 RepID=A0A1I1NWC3_9CLOT|nr:hypothetical protein [Clostridium uliginosum]SFD01974.1 hypothetical protein SAMN05421842_11722 [Clostridium uliginosum]
MKIKKFLIVFLISIIAFTENTNAIPISDTYKQGIYNISEITQINATAKLITPNNVTSLIILDSNVNQKFYKKFDTVDEIINLGSLKNGDIIAILGSGQIAINFSK